MTRETELTGNSDIFQFCLFYENGSINIVHVDTGITSFPEAQNVEYTLTQWWFNIVMLNHQWVNVYSTLIQCWVTVLCPVGSITGKNETFKFQRYSGE